MESCEFTSFQHCISRLTGGSLNKKLNLYTGGISAVVTRIKISTQAQAHTHKNQRQLNTYHFIASVRSNFTQTLRCAAKLTHHFLLFAIHFVNLMCSSQRQSHRAVPVQRVLIDSPGALA